MYISPDSEAVLSLPRGKQKVSYEFTAREYRVWASPCTDLCGWKGKLSLSIHEGDKHLCKRCGALVKLQGTAADEEKPKKKRLSKKERNDDDDDDVDSMFARLPDRYHFEPI